MDTKKERLTQATYTIPLGSVKPGTQITIPLGPLLAGAHPDATYSVWRGYERADGREKVVAGLYGLRSQPIPDLDSAILDGCPVVAAVDTNQSEGGAWTTHIQLYRPDHGARVLYATEGWTYTFTVGGRYKT